MVINLVHNFAQAARLWCQVMAATTARKPSRSLCAWQPLMALARRVSLYIVPLHQGSVRLVLVIVHPACLLCASRTWHVDWAHQISHSDLSQLHGVKCMVKPHSALGSSGIACSFGVSGQSWSRSSSLHTMVILCAAADNNLHAVLSHNQSFCAVQS